MLTKTLNTNSLDSYMIASSESLFSIDVHYSTFHMIEATCKRKSKNKNIFFIM